MKQLIVKFLSSAVSYFLTGLTWIASAYFLPEGSLRNGFVIFGCFAVVFIFLYQHIYHVRKLLDEKTGIKKHVFAIGINFLVLIVTFAGVYTIVGLMDNTQLDTPVIHSFGLSVYFSIVTFTTLGYGDFYAVNVGKILASLQALTGFLILGILASTTASLLSRKNRQSGKKK